MAALAKIASDRLSVWRHDPVAFVTDNWSVQLEDFQAEALTALADRGRVAIRSGHGVGKSTLDAWAVLWFMCTRFPTKVPCTAPTAHQLEDVLQAEIAQWHRAMSPALRDQFVRKADRFELREAPKESFASFRTGNKHTPEALQGFHSDNLLFVIDEASGIADEVFVVAEGALSTPDAKVLMTSNPTRTTGYFAEAHTRERGHWHCMKVSCEDSSRVAPSYVEGMERYGRDSNIFRVRVLGEFPTADDAAIIPLEWVEAAIGREVTRVPGPPVWGLDVARFGDDRSALAKRGNNVLLEPVKSWRNKDTMQTAGIVIREYEETPEKDKPSVINVDVIGLGAGVVDRLKEEGLPVRGINVAEQPSSSEKYMRLRDELWFAGREWFEQRECSMADDQELVGELTAVLYGVSPSGKLQAESKEHMKRQGRVSPDLADAFLLTFARGGAPLKRSWKPLKYDNRWIV